MEIIARRRPIYFDEALKMSEALDVELASLIGSVCEQIISEKLGSMSRPLAMMVDCQEREKGSETDEGFDSI